MYFSPFYSKDICITLEAEGSGRKRAKRPIAETLLLNNIYRVSIYVHKKLLFPFLEVLTEGHLTYKRNYKYSLFAGRCQSTLCSEWQSRR